MTSFMRQAAALFARMGWELTPPETAAERHARMCGECKRLAEETKPVPISEQERRRHRWLVAREMRRAEAKRKQQ